jgi:hypothetical protein
MDLAGHYFPVLTSSVSEHVRDNARAYLFQTAANL